MARVLLTGADGFIGAALTRSLRQLGHQVVGVTRSGQGDGLHAVGDIAAFNDWSRLLQGVDVVVHAAGRAHVLNEPSADPIREFRRVNVKASLTLAQAAMQSHVTRFVFLSSIGVNGAGSIQPFSASDPPNPGEPYAISKWEAEQQLQVLCDGSNMELVRARFPLVVGAGVKGNLLRLLKLVDSGLPLPFGTIKNERSYVELQDLCQGLNACMFDPRAAGQVLLFADEERFSTPQMMRLIAAGLSRRSRVIDVPSAWLRVLVSLPRLGGLYQRMMSSLVVDVAHTRAVVGWQACRGVRCGIQDMATAYLAGTRK